MCLFIFIFFISESESVGPNKTASHTPRSQGPPKPIA